MSVRKHSSGSPHEPRGRRELPTIAESAFNFYVDTFDMPNVGMTWTLEIFPILYRATLESLRGRFARGELLLMLDAMNGLILTPEIAGQRVALEIADAIALQGLDKKWHVESKSLGKKIAGLSLFERVCVEVWASSCWLTPDAAEDEWLAPLLPVPLGVAELALLERAEGAMERWIAARDAAEDAEWRRMATLSEAERCAELSAERFDRTFPTWHLEADMLADREAAERLGALGLVDGAEDPGGTRFIVTITTPGRHRAAWERVDRAWRKEMGR
jgi:hypothetical protein